MAAAYRKGREEAGFVESMNVLIESRWADGQYDRLRYPHPRAEPWPHQNFRRFGLK
jgi:hypothetical protein